MNFHEWVKYVFDREVTEPQWFFRGPEIQSLELATFIEFGTRLLSESGEILASFSDRQVNDGLYYIISPNSSDDIFALKSETVKLAHRVEFIESIYSLYRDCFNQRCTPHLSHRDLVSTGTPVCMSALNKICYMWWDIFIIWGDPDDKTVEPLNRAGLSVMEKSLRLSNIAPIEGALHGLGEFALYYPEECARIIDDFLQRAVSIPEDLRQYALAAREGAVL